MARFARGTLQLAIHDEVYVLRSLDAFTVYVLADLQPVQIRVLHHDIESFQADFREDRVSESNIFQNKCTLDIPRILVLFIVLDQKFDR